MQRIAGRRMRIFIIPEYRIREAYLMSEMDQLNDGFLIRSKSVTMLNII